ncbi:hypothetical protein KL918_003810 [Ogataea parapolymorpha]|uniref:Cop9 signalosome complex subunit 11 n=1 Tax=Ogataea parapolymorpha (strain ATCC 26012 / BCRC 20466 / JCM 22074 / NRRL Y-7560 / DL-1) TaxID=871575 RepID=W1QK77_OGAPD|nr:Cop9 signalosome complex subunit 11 [Ogataea parapolymorpha DL-1]ESX02262.1 Cop9 signalosome complex subunit 11 [Ogataea parapolymorpha DL-1]KAG7866345.1 hypothetical protein KL918_003810 [Ogataea parapolymorpha]KAG7872973.1 hypothetical protein KL916_002703 [Ogataea parapolymorpha]
MYVDLYLDKYEKGPLYVKRLAYICQEFPISTDVVHKLLDMIVDPRSPYKYFKDTPRLLRITGNEVYLQRYNELQVTTNSKPNFDDELLKLAKLEPTQANFERIVDLLHLRTVHTLMTTASSDNVGDNSGFYYNLGSEFSAMFRKRSFRELQKLIVYKAYDGNLASSTVFLRRKLQQVLEYERDDESDEDDRMDSDEYNLDKEEAIAYWTCRWYLLYALFLSNNYQAVVEEYFQLTKEPAIAGYTASDVLANEYSNELIFKEYLLRTVCFSVLVAEKMQNLETRWTEMIRESFASDPPLRKLIKLYTGCRFSDLKNVLTEFQSEFDYDEQLSHSYRLWKRTFEYKICVFYLSLVKKVTFDHLEAVLGTTSEEITKLISLFKLRVKIDQKNNLVEFQDTDSYIDLDKQIQSLNDATVAEMRALEVNRMVKEAFD